jgi:hypothetical protein
VAAVAQQTHVLGLDPPEMIEQQVPGLMTDEHAVNLVDVGVVFVLSSEIVSDADGIPLAEQDASDRFMVATCPVKRLAHGQRPTYDQDPQRQRLRVQ